MKPTALVLLSVAVAVVSTACSHAPDAAPAASAAPLAVTTARAEMTELPATFEAGGIVRSWTTAAIASRVMATVTQVRVRVGDRVRQGTPLVTLDAREVTANRDRARASAAAAREASLAAEADVAAAEAGLTLARATHQRIAELAAKRSATPQELDQAVAGMHAADAQLRAARARLAAAIAGHDAADAAGSAADTALTYTQLLAPFDAIITGRSIEPGAIAAPGVTLLTLEDPAHARLEVRLDESRTGRVRVGDVVNISLSADAGATPAWNAAKVSEIAQLDPASHTFTVKIDLPAQTGVRSGSFGRARFSGPARQALTVPVTALVRRGQLSFVFTVDATNTARLRAVSPGMTADGRVETLAGLSAGELIIANPPPALTDGRPVQPGTDVARGGGGR